MNRILSLILFVVLVTGCHQVHVRRSAESVAKEGTKPQAKASAPPGLDACQVALAAVAGEGVLDRQIESAQKAVRANPQGQAALERLGWLFVAKARASFDDGFYKLAEQCAACIETRWPGDAGGMLLRGHVFHNTHRFKEAEPIARQLVSSRGAPFDHGLLGDVLMELGQLDQAAASYQRMMDLRPDSRALARAAHLRWLKGDLPGAVAAMQEAARAVGTRDAESAAWMHTRLGFYQLASGETSLADEACAAALQCQADYPPALLMQGRALLAAGEYAQAVEPLRRAAAANPLPEYQWVLAEALFESGRFDEARATETELRKHGAERDPRTFALFLATRREQLDLALSLAQRELQQRADVFTHDALAWCLAAAGRFDEARTHLEAALAEGTMDGRLLCHAAIIADRSGQPAEAARHRTRAEPVAHLLLPSERLQLQTRLESRRGD